MIDTRQAQSATVRRFGRRQPFVLAEPLPEPAWASLSDDLKLFATTFVGGLLFMTIYLA